MDSEDDKTYALEQASKWAERIQEWRKQGTPIPRPITESAVIPLLSSMGI